jgi:hypothetical protein
MTCSEIVLGVLGVATLAGAGYFVYKAVEPTKPGEYALVQQISSDMEQYYQNPDQFTFEQRRDSLDSFMGQLTEAGIQAPAARTELTEIIEDITILRNDYRLLQDQDLYALNMEHVYSETKDLIPDTNKSFNWFPAALIFFLGGMMTISTAVEIDDWGRE